MHYLYIYILMFTSSNIMIYKLFVWVTQLVIVICCFVVTYFEKKIIIQFSLDISHGHQFSLKTFIFAPQKTKILIKKKNKKQKKTKTKKKKKKSIFVFLNFL
jgi:hypothetical protein